MDCECSNAGFCPRYQRNMTETMHRICCGEILPDRKEHFQKIWLKGGPEPVPPEEGIGLGDVVHSIAKATGMDKVAKKVANLMGKSDCGCDKRRKSLNKIRLKSRSKVSDYFKSIEPLSDQPWSREVEDTEIVVKSFRRHHLLLRFVNSVREFYDVPIRIVDDSGQATSTAEEVKAIPGVIWHDMPYDSGLPAGRNLGVRESSAKYIVLCDDDFIFTEQTDLSALLPPLSELDICGGLVRWRGKVAENWCGQLTFEGNRPHRSVVMQPISTKMHTRDGVRFWHTDLTFNFFAAKRELLLQNPWDERYKIGDEHLDYFLAHKEAGTKVGFTPECVCDHDRSSGGEYQKLRSRRNENALEEKWGISTRHTIPITQFPRL